MDTRIRQLSCEQANIKEQNQQLRSLNIQLQEQVESSREQLQAALGQLSLLQLSAAQEQVDRQRWVVNSTCSCLNVPGIRSDTDSWKHSFLLVWLVLFFKGHSWHDLFFFFKEIAGIDWKLTMCCAVLPTWNLTTRSLINNPNTAEHCNFLFSVYDNLWHQGCECEIYQTDWLERRNYTPSFQDSRLHY